MQLQQSVEKTHQEEPKASVKTNNSEVFSDNSSSKRARREDSEEIPSISPFLDRERPAVRVGKRLRDQLKIVVVVEMKPDTQQAADVPEAKTLAASSNLVQAEGEQQHKKQKLSCEKEAEAVQLDNKKEETEQKGNDIAQQEELSEGETDSGEDESEASEEDPKSEDKEVEAAQDTQQACIALYHEAVRDEIQLRAAERHRERWQLPKRDLEMRYRKVHLGLPNDHCWVHEVWLEFEKLSKTKLVEDFWLDLEEVLFLFPTEEKYQEMHEAPQASDSRL